MQWLGSNIQGWSSLTAQAQKPIEGGNYFVPGPRSPLKSCQPWHPRMAPTFNFLENKKKFHTNIWVGTCPWACSLGLLREAIRRKNLLLFGNFPKGGGGSCPNPIFLRNFFVLFMFGYFSERGVKAVWKKSKQKQIFSQDGFPYSLNFKHACKCLQDVTWKSAAVRHLLEALCSPSFIAPEMDPLWLLDRWTINVPPNKLVKMIYSGPRGRIQPSVAGTGKSGDRALRRPVGEREHPLRPVSRPAEGLETLLGQPPQKLHILVGLV